VDIKAKAKFLANASLDKGGAPRLERVKAALEYIEMHEPAAKKLGVARLYKKQLKLLMARRRAKIEHAGALNMDALKTLEAFIKERLQADVSVSVSENTSLIAGVRVICGDDVFENSVSQNLSQIGEAFAQTRA